MMEKEVVLNSFLEEINGIKKQKLQEKIDSMKYTAENGFWEFCKYLYPAFFKDEQTERARYALVLNNCGGWTLSGEEKYKKYKKVMINVFPRFGKSFMLSIWCVWLLWQFPHGAIMRNAHDATLAEKFSRDVRNMIEVASTEEEFKTLISVSNRIHSVAPKLQLSKDKRSLNMWALKTAKDISYFCAGVRGAITGNGCDLAMILDDPVKDPEKAMSASFSEELLTWYLTVHRSRQDRDSKAFGCEVIVMARWSDDDLCSKLLESESDWHIVYFDAENEVGDSACESIFPTDKMKEMRQGFINTGRLKWWNALYRQQVEDLGKKLFRSDKLLRFDPSEYNFEASPHRYLKIAYGDVADEGEDSLAMPIGWYDMALGEIFITDVIFSSEESKITIPICASKIIKDKIKTICFESNNGGKYFGELVEIEMRQLCQQDEKMSGFPKDVSFEYRRTTTNKETKILVYSTIVMSKIHFLEGSLIEEGSNYYLFLKELTGYQKERKNLHDDAADSICSMAKRFCAENGFDIF